MTPNLTSILDIQRYAPPAQRALAASQVLADTMSHAEVTPDHLALAFTVVVPDALTEAGVDREAWKQRASRRLRGGRVGPRAVVSAELLQLLEELARTSTGELSAATVVAGLIRLDERRAPSALGTRAGARLREHLASQPRAHRFASAVDDGAGVLCEIEAIFAADRAPGMLVDRSGSVLFIRRPTTEIRVTWHAAVGAFEVVRRSPEGPSAPMNIPLGQGESDPAERLVEALCAALN